MTLRNPSSVSLMDKYKDDVVIDMSSMTLAEQISKISAVVGIELIKPTAMQSALGHKVDTTGLVSLGGMTGGTVFSGCFHPFIIRY